MTDEQVKLALQALLPRADRFAAASAIARELAATSRDTLTKLADVEGRLSQVRPTEYANNGDEGQRDGLKRALRTLEPELLNLVSHLEAEERAEKMSTENADIARKMYVVTILTTIATGASVLASAFCCYVAWKQFKLEEQVSSQRQSAPTDPTSSQ